MAVNYGVLREVKVIQPVHTPWKQIVVNSGMHCLVHSSFIFSKYFLGHDA